MDLTNLSPEEFLGEHTIEEGPQLADFATDVALLLTGLLSPVVLDLGHGVTIQEMIGVASNLILTEAKTQLDATAATCSLLNIAIEVADMPRR